MKKTLLTILCTVLVCSCVMGATLAFLMDKTDSIENTFTVGKVKIELAETTGPKYKMIPGSEIEKDPTVTVKAESEACWLFVKIEETNNVYETDKKYLTYTLNGWTPVEGETGVYSKAVSASDDDQEFSVFTGNKVTVSDDVTQTTAQVTIKVTAYAVQAEGFDTAAEAWVEAEKLG